MPTVITLSNNQRIWLDTVQGMVIEASQDVVPVVHQERDQRQMIGQTMVLRPGRVYTDVVSISQVWIRADDGSESKFDLSDFPVDMRVGHKLALVFGAAEGVKDGTVFGAINVTTGKSNFDKSIHCSRLAPFGLYLTPNFYRNRLKLGAAAGLILSLYFCVTQKSIEYAFFGLFMGTVISIPIAFFQSILWQISGQGLLPELNQLASKFLCSEAKRT
jgi:hypothetical protein